MRSPGEDEEPTATLQRPSPKHISRLPAHLQLNPPPAPRKLPTAGALVSEQPVVNAAAVALGASVSEAPAGPDVGGTAVPGAGTHMPNAAAAVSEAAATPAARKLSDCKSRACSGVLKAFKRALHEEGQTAAAGPPSPASSLAASSPAPAPPPAPGASAPHPAAPASATIAAAVGTAMGAAACAAEGGAASGTAGGGAGASGAPPLPCPPDTWELGRATWTFLHSVAAGYPESPSERQQGLMRGMVEGLAEFYPCEVCREHLR